MPDIFSPNFIGDIRLNGSAGTSNQRIRSNGANQQATWTDTQLSLAWANNQLTVTVDGNAQQQTLNLISADAGNVATAGTDGRVFVSGNNLTRNFKYTSPSALSHVITHNLNNAFPDVVVYDTATSQVVIPTSITSNSANQLTIVFAVARAIAGTIVG